MSENKKIDIIYSKYEYSSDEVENSILRNIIFNGKYWISSRCFVNAYYSDSYTTHNVVMMITSNRIGDYCIVDGKKDKFVIEARANYGNSIRPIITLKPNIEVIESENNSNVWILK